MGLGAGSPTFGCLSGSALARTPQRPRLLRGGAVGCADAVDDVFAKEGKLDAIAVERTSLGAGGVPLLAEHDLAYHLASERGSERREIRDARPGATRPGPARSTRAQDDDRQAGEDEHATAYYVRDRGLVVITSCGHAGVINSVRQCQKVSGIDKVHAIVGGFHLAPAPDEIVAKTVEAFNQIDPDYITPAHCTGLSTIMVVHRELPKKLVMPSTGTRITFGA